MRQTVPAGRSFFLWGFFLLSFLVFEGSGTGMGSRKAHFRERRRGAACRAKGRAVVLLFGKAAYGRKIRYTEKARRGGHGKERRKTGIQ